jgi:hypothetical protein
MSMMEISMPYGKFEDIDDLMKHICDLSRYMSHSDLYHKIKNMDERETVELAATINELAYHWNKLKGISE